MSKRGTKIDNAISNQPDQYMVQKVVEDVLSSEKFMEGLISCLTMRITDIIKEQVLSLTAKYEEKISVLENKIDRLEQEGKERNLCVYGSDPGFCNNDKVDEVIEFFNTKMGIALGRESIEDIFSFRRPGKGDRENGLVKFTSKHFRDLVYRNKAKLKGTGVVLREDLTHFRHRLLQLCIGTFGKRNVWTDNGRIKTKIQGKLHYIENSTQLDVLESVSRAAGTAAYDRNRPVF